MAFSLAGPHISRCAIVVLQEGLIVMSPTVGRALRTISFTAAVAVSWSIAVFALSSVPRAQGASDGSAMTPVRRTFGTQITVCRDGCVIVRMNDRRSFERDADLTAAALRAIGLNHTGNVGR